MGVNGENMEDKRGVSDLWGGEKILLAPLDSGGGNKVGEEPG